MSVASPFPAPKESQTPAKSGDIWDFAEVCLEQTADALHHARVASPSEISQAVATIRESHAQQRPADLIEALARIQGHAEEHVGAAVMEIGNKIATTQVPYAPYVPFAGRMIAPSAFYESYDQIHRIARVLLSPVIFAEDTDAIGTASANPIASALLAEEIRTTVHKRFGIRPFVSVVRLDYESWTFLIRKHFEL